VAKANNLGPYQHNKRWVFMVNRMVMGVPLFLLSAALWAQQGANASVGSQQRKESLRQAVSSPNTSSTPQDGDTRAARQLSPKERTHLRQQLRHQPPESARTSASNCATSLQRAHAPAVERAVRSTPGTGANPRLPKLMLTRVLLVDTLDPDQVLFQHLDEHQRIARQRNIGTV